MEDRITRRMRKTGDALAQRNAMHFIATERDDWDLASFLESGKKTLRELWELIGQVPVGDGVALDLGCGIGRLSFALAEIFERVIGVDVSEAMIVRARQLQQQLGCTNVDFFCNNGRDLSFVPTGSCCLGFSFIVFQHIPEPNVVLGYIKELGRVTRQGGYVLFQVPVYRQTLWVMPWRFVQALFRSSLWVAEPLGLVRPERGLAFRGSRLPWGRLDRCLRENALLPLVIHRAPSRYRLCNDLVIYCRRE
jgi:SAM-dependent methyltransferase